MITKVRRLVDTLIHGKAEQVIPKDDLMRKEIINWNNLYQKDISSDNEKTLSLHSAVTSELARLVTLELESEVSELEELDKIYKREVIDVIRERTEVGCALGSLIFKPYVTERGELKVDYISPLDFVVNNQDLTDVSFLDKREQDGVSYIRVERHVLNTDGTYDITNVAYKSYDGFTGTQVSLAVVDEWRHLAPGVRLENMDRMLFSMFRVPNANTIDRKSPLGISVFHKGIPQIKDAEEQYGRILWEYEGSELAIDADVTMFDGPNVDRLPQGKDRLFRRVDTGEDGFYKVFAPDIRDTSLFNGLNKILQRVEFNCGLAYGTISEVEGEAKTATEIKASKQRSFSTVRDIQKSLELALTELVEVMVIMIQLYNLPIQTSDELSISFDFDDSLVIDSKEEHLILLQEVAAGIISKEEYLMRRYGVDELQAQEMMPRSEVEDDVDSYLPSDH